jgi:hypothetical protein
MKFPCNFNYGSMFPSLLILSIKIFPLQFQFLDFIDDIYRNYHIYIFVIL